MSNLECKSIIVVEGIHDLALIKSIYPDVEVITTNGSEISDNTLDMIENMSKTHKIILLLDPDHPGERIRSIITNRVPNACQAFINKKDGVDEHKHKVGIEHATKETIIKALENMLTPSTNSGSLTEYDLYELGLSGDINSKAKREYIASTYVLGNPNAKTILRRLNLIGITKEELEKKLSEKNWNL